jgi:hypothetical protein
MRGEPATKRQMDYVQGLVAQLRRILDDGTDIADKLDQASHATLSKKDAHDLIDALKGALAELRGDGPPDGATNVVEFPTPAPSPKLTPHEERMRQLRERELALKKRQDAWFGNEERRAAPPGERYIKVWQESRNRVGYRFREPDVLSGWVWECRHPSHVDGRSRSGRVRGGSQLGRATTMNNALLHWSKYHRDSEN